MKLTNISSLYTSGEYITRNPGLHEEDSAWKLSKIIPLIDQFAQEFAKKEPVILDVGGGAGVILREISDYLTERFDKKITKICLDLSQGMLEVQKKNNPEARIIQGDIGQTDLPDQSIDLVLMIDVLEHVAEPAKVLSEISRVARYAIFKVPLEDTLYYRCMDLITRGKFRKRIIDAIGHINVYNAVTLKTEIEKHCGQIIREDFTGVYGYLWRKKTETAISRLFNFVGNLFFLISPALAARIFNDYRVILVKCYGKD